MWQQRNLKNVTLNTGKVLINASLFCIHPSIHPNTNIAHSLGLQRKLEPMWTDFAWEPGYTLGKSAISLFHTSITLWDETRTGKWGACTERSAAMLQPGSFLLWDCYEMTTAPQGCPDPSAWLTEVEPDVVFSSTCPSALIVQIKWPKGATKYYSEKL